VSILPDPEFNRAIPLSEIGAGAVERTIEADESERAALATRFELLGLSKLSATISLHRDGEAFVAKGRFVADAVQACVATGAAVAAHIDAPLEVRFIADPGHAPDTEIELTGDDCDTVFHNGRVIDLGEVAAQSLALALDPFPRSAKAQEILKAAGVIEEEEAQAATGPFAALAALRDTGKKP
jgi:uncharacterized metal-binding protein YceD (DUF177 family)